MHAMEVNGGAKDRLADTVLVEVESVTGTGAGVGAA